MVLQELAAVSSACLILQLFEILHKSAGTSTSLLLDPAFSTLLFSLFLDREVAVLWWDVTFLIDSLLSAVATQDLNETVGLFDLILITFD